MASTYSTNLKIELQGTGDNSGTWGSITNTNLGTALEQAVVGYGNPDFATDANLTLTYIDSNATQTARALVLNVTSTGSLTATRELVVPTIQKQYIVQNNTSGSQSITVKTASGTGITIPNGRKAHLYVDGTNVIFMDDYVDINGGSIDGTPIGSSSPSTASFSNLTATSGTVTTLASTSATITALSGTNFSATSLTLANALKVGQGGTGVSSAPTNGQLLIGDGAGFILGTLTAGTGVTVTNATGSITIAATGSGGTVTSVTASSPLASSGGNTPNITINSSTGSGAVVLADGPTISSGTITTLTSTTANITTLTGTNFAATSLTLTNALTRAQGGTGVSTAPTNGQILIGNGSGYTLSTITAGSGIVVTNATGSISISASATGGGLPTVVVTASTAISAAASFHYVLTATTTATVTLPSSPALSDTVYVTVQNGLLTNVVARNGQNIQGIAEDMTLNAPYAAVQLRFSDATRGWVLA